MGDVMVVGAEAAALSVEQVSSQVAHIQRLMSALMREGEHFGTIPGTQKPSLLKAGAEKLGFTFRLIPEFDVKQTDLGNGHREYSVVCTLRHGPTGSLAGQGVGMASTMEAKYRWRKQAIETEAGPLPAGYWDLAKDDYKARNELIAATYGPGKYKAKKTTDHGWVALRVEGDGERVENPDIADTYNTVLKMAKKRAHVDAIITATAASDLFTQDVEDEHEERVPERRVEESAQRPAAPRIADDPDVVAVRESIKAEATKRGIYEDAKAEYGKMIAKYGADKDVLVAALRGYLRDISREVAS